MTKRRSRGDGGLHWDKSRERWIATATVGFTPAGKRITKKGSGKTKTEAKNKLKDILRDLEDGLAVGVHGYTVADAIESWLTFGLPGRDPNTVENCTTLATVHILPSLGARKLRELSADDVDEWLASKAGDLSTETLKKLLSILRRAIKRAQARDKVKRNVAMLCDPPAGRPGRPSKSLTLAQAEAVLSASEESPLHAYIVLSLLTGARTEEMRALTWDRLDLEGRPGADPPMHPSMQVWRSVRTGGDTKTRKSRRTLRLPERCVEALRKHRTAQARQREMAGTRWTETGMVFCTTIGTELDAANVRRAFRAVIKDAGLKPTDWTPRELRHSFVSLMSDAGVPIEAIARLIGHRSTIVTETVYRQQLRPVLTEGAEAMDVLLAASRQGNG